MCCLLAKCPVRTRASCDPQEKGLLDAVQIANCMEEVGFAVPDQRSGVNKVIDYEIDA